MPEPAPVTTAMWLWRRGMGVFSVLVFERSIQANSKLRKLKRQAPLARCSHSFPVMPMDQQFNAWKSAIERFWPAATPDYREVARLAAEIAAGSADETLRQAAAQALPSLRNASLKSADRRAQKVARGELGVVRGGLP